MNDEIYFPGHGGRVYQPQRLVKAYVLHRRMREQSILECIRNGKTTIPEIVAVIYRGLDPTAREGGVSFGGGAR